MSKADAAGPRWTADEIKKFFHAFNQYGKDWDAVATLVPTRKPGMCRALYRIPLVKYFFKLQEVKPDNGNPEELVAAISRYYKNQSDGSSDSESSESGANDDEDDSMAEAESKPTASYQAGESKSGLKTPSKKKASSPADHHGNDVESSQKDVTTKRGKRRLFGDTTPASAKKKPRQVSSTPRRQTAKTKLKELRETIMELQAEQEKNASAYNVKPAPIERVRKDRRKRLVDGIPSAYQNGLQKLRSVPHLNVAADVYALKLAELVNGLCSGLKYWTVCEWFYSTLDREFFMHNDFIACLQELKMGEVSKLTRTEWSIVRSAMGRPRRLSSAFLRGERARLAEYRSRVRTLQRNKKLLQEPASEFPYAIPAALSVGQRVTAFHPKVKQLHVGKILTADHAECVFRVQFDIPQLGVELLPDTAILGHEPVRILLERADIPVTNVGIRMLSDAERNEFENLQKNVSLTDDIESASKYFHAQLSHARLMRSTPTWQPRELSILAKLSRILDRKEAIISELKDMNQEAQRMMETRNFSGDSVYPQAFRAQYNWLRQNLESTNRVLDVAMQKFRELSQGQINGAQDQTPWTVANDEDVDLSELQKDNLGKILIACQKSSVRLVQQHQKSTELADPSDGEDQIKSLITNCMTLLMALRECASLTPMEVKHLLSKAIAHIKPLHESNYSVYKEIESCIDLIGTACAVNFAENEAEK